MSTMQPNRGATGGRFPRATSYDVARAAGVAQSTVSRCFRPDSGISEATRARVREAAAELGYTPNAVARSLITRRSNMVGVIVTAFTLRNNPDLVYAIGTALAEAGQRLMLMAVADEERVEDTLQAALEYPLDGILSAALIPAHAVRRFQERGVPVVFFNRPTSLRHVDQVATDHAAAAAAIARALHRAGRRRFLCVSGRAASPVSIARTKGFLGAAAAVGVPATVVETDYPYAAGRSAFVAYVRGAAPAAAKAAGTVPDAVFCTNDQLAFGVMDACRHDLGLRVPDDVAVAGFDDVEEAGRPSYELTTVRQRLDQMARTAAAMLARRLAQPDAPAECALVPGDLVFRRSTGIANSAA